MIDRNLLSNRNRKYINFGLSEPIPKPKPKVRAYRKQTENIGSLLINVLLLLLRRQEKGEKGEILSEKKRRKYCPQSSILLYHIRTIGFSLSHSSLSVSVSLSLPLSLSTLRLLTLHLFSLLFAKKGFYCKKQNS